MFLNGMWDIMDCFVQKHVQTNNIKLSRCCSFEWCSYCRGYYLVMISASNAESNSITSSWRVAGAWPAAWRCLVGQVSWRGLVGPVSVWQDWRMEAPREYGWWRLLVFLVAGGTAARGAEGKIKWFSTKHAPTPSSGLFAKEASPRLANPPSSFSGGLAALGSTFFLSRTSHW